MSLLIGASWLLYWTLVKVFHVDSLDAVLATGIVFIVVGLIFENYPRFRRQ